MTRTSSGLAVIALLASAVFVRPVAHAEGDQVKPVRTEKLPNVAGKSITTVVVNYAPGGKSASHHHAGRSAVAY